MDYVWMKKIVEIDRLIADEEKGNKCSTRLLQLIGKRKLLQRALNNVLGGC